MTRELFSKFTVKDEPIYFTDEDLKDVPYDRLADRANALNIMEARLDSIASIIEGCRVVLDDEGNEAKEIVINGGYGWEPFEVDEDYNVDRFALRTLMALYWGLCRSLDELRTELGRYNSELHHEATLRDSHNVLSLMEYHHIENDHLNYNYVQPKEEKI